MGGTRSLQGLMKWLSRDEWRDLFAEVFDRHLLPACERTGVDVDQVISILGQDWFMTTVWGCAFEDFLTRAVVRRTFGLGGSASDRDANPRTAHGIAAAYPIAAGAGPV